MHRIQIQLTADQERALKEVARLRGVSISALVREGVDLLIAQPGGDASEFDRALDLIGMLDSGGPTDVSENHDQYLAEIYAEQLR